MEENIHLKSRLQVAEAGQRQGSSAEQDYEEVIQLLEAEIRDLKNQLASKRQARGVEATKVSLKLSVATCFLHLLCCISHDFTPPHLFDHFEHLYHLHTGGQQQKQMCVRTTSRASLDSNPEPTVVQTWRFSLHVTSCGIF